MLPKIVYWAKVEGKLFFPMRNALDRSYRDHLFKLSRHAVSFPPLDQVNIMSCHVMLSVLKTVVSFYLKGEDEAAFE